MQHNIVYLIADAGGWGVYPADAEHPDESLFWGSYNEACAWLAAKGYHHKERNIYEKVD